MQIKEGASLQGLQLVMREALIAGDAIWKGKNQELVVTSGTDGVHSAGSLHYYGLAVDFRTHYFTEPEKITVFNQLRNELPEFDVVLEKTHIHVEYDQM
jgi:hypothetical protein